MIMHWVRHQSAKLPNWSVFQKFFDHKCCPLTVKEAFPPSCCVVNNGEHCLQVKKKQSLNKRKQFSGPLPPQPPIIMGELSKESSPGWNWIPPDCSISMNVGNRLGVSRSDILSIFIEKHLSGWKDPLRSAGAAVLRCRAQRSSETQGRKCGDPATEVSRHLPAPTSTVPFLPSAWLIRVPGRFCLSKREVLKNQLVCWSIQNRILSPSHTSPLWSMAPSIPPLRCPLDV